jgi:hypothetical protein
MLCKSFIASIFLLALTSSVDAHAAIAPALGAEGTPTLDDVQEPSTSSPCGNINIADNLDTSKLPLLRPRQTENFWSPSQTSSEYIIHAHPLSANGSADVEIVSTDDGSRSIEAVKIDTSGTGDNFGATASVIANGDPVRAVCCTLCPSWSLISPSILRTTPRSRSWPSSLLVPCALVEATETVVLHRSLRLMDSEIASLLNRHAGRPQRLAKLRLPPRSPQVLAIPVSDPVGFTFSATSYEKDITNFWPRGFPFVGQDCRTSDRENELEYTW